MEITVVQLIYCWCGGRAFHMLMSLFIFIPAVPAVTASMGEELMLLVAAF